MQLRASAWDGWHWLAIERRHRLAVYSSSHSNDLAIWSDHFPRHSCALADSRAVSPTGVSGLICHVIATMVLDAMEASRSSLPLVLFDMPPRLFHEPMVLVQEHIALMHKVLSGGWLVGLGCRRIAQKDGDLLGLVCQVFLCLGIPRE